MGSVPLIVRQSPAAPASAVLVQVPVNTWEAYNPWGGKSLYQFGTSRHAVEVSFDRPYDQRMFDNMVTKLELPWVRFLERNGIDVSYQTDVDTDTAPGSLLRHRLVFAIGHDEYWTQAIRDAFDRALAQSTNLMFGSDSADWRMRYADGRANDRAVAGSRGRPGPQPEPRQRVLQRVRRARVPADGSPAPVGRAARPDRAADLVHGGGAAQRSLAGGGRPDARGGDPGGRRLRVGLACPRLL